MQSVVANGQKKTSKAKAVCQQSQNFTITINKCPLNTIADELLRYKFYDVISVIGLKYFENLQIDISVKGGGSVSRIYAARQAMCKALLEYYSKYLDEWNKQEIKNNLLAFDRFTLIADPRRQEPKRFGGPGARARYQKSYR